MGDKLLDQVYNETRAKVASLFEGDHYLTLSTDFWTNCRSESVMDVNVVGRKGSSFLGSYFPTKDQKKNADYISTKLREAHSLVKELTKTPVVSVVTDNAAVMLAATRLLDEPGEEEEIWTKTGCVIHRYSLLFKDICSLPHFEVTLKKMRDVAVFFKRRAKAQAVLEGRQKELSENVTSVPLPSHTRFGYHYVTLEWFLKNVDALKAAVVHPSWTDMELDGEQGDLQAGEVNGILLNDGWWKKLRTLSLLLDPLWSMIRKADKDGLEYMGYVYDDLCNFETHVKAFKTNIPPSTHAPLPDTVLRSIERLVKDRWEEIHHPMHSVGYVFNPKLKHNTTVMEERHIRQDLLTIFASFAGDNNEQAQCMQKTMDFLKRENAFSEELLWSGAALNSSILSWWETWTTDTVLGPLRAVLLRVFSTALVTSASERTFSLFGHVHRRLRNRLYNAKVEKTVFIHQNLRRLAKKGSSDAYVTYAESECSDTNSDEA